MNLNKPGNFFARVKKSPEEFLVIHYSCQSLYDDAPGLSPRITSIAVTHYSSDQSMSFSTHAIAEELGVAKRSVFKQFDAIEKELLERFYSFVQNYRGSYWVHWNMRNLTYGFEHLEHRARALGINDPPFVPPSQRLNLSDILRAKYGKDYANHPQMATLMELNGGKPRDFLDGRAEAGAFENREFIGMHQSTLAKVGFFCAVIRKAQKNRLKTTSVNLGARIDRMFDSRWVKVLGLVGMIASVVLGIAALVGG